MCRKGHKTQKKCVKISKITLKQVIFFTVLRSKARILRRLWTILRRRASACLPLLETLFKFNPIIGFMFADLFSVNPLYRSNLQFCLQTPWLIMPANYTLPRITQISICYSSFMTAVMTQLSSLPRMRAGYRTVGFSLSSCPPSPAGRLLLTMQEATRGVG